MNVDLSKISPAALSATTARVRSFLQRRLAQIAPGEPIKLVLVSELKPLPIPKPPWDYREHVYALARKEEQKFVALAEKLWPEAVAEYQRDRDAFKFDCARWGDFLTIFVHRAYEDGVRQFTSSVNIGKSRAIHFWPGREPDRASTLKYFAVEWNTKYINVFGKKGAEWGFEDSQYSISTDPNIYEKVDKRHNILAIDSGNGDGVARGSDFYARRRVLSSIETENFPREAIDDRIRFEGAGATLHVPAGLGRAVYDQIMRAIADQKPTARVAKRTQSKSRTGRAKPAEQSA